MDVNLHGKNLYQARIAVRSALMRATAADYRIRIIHGYRGGTAIRDMVREEFSVHPRVIRVENSLNPGETVLVLREYI
ncbi:MAG: Smr/MutS family protein [Eubacteriales bacterium]|nr:Smr/MutS family protein [Eubacteriales bacterium]